VSDLPYGVYEHVVTQGLARRLQLVDDDLVKRRELDPEDAFPTLPAGCHIQLDRIAKSIVLRNLATALAVRKPDLVRELRDLGDVSLPEFLSETGLELEDLYRNRAMGGWTGLRKAAGLAPDDGADDPVMTATIGRMLHVDDVDRLDRLRRWTPDSPVTRPPRQGSGAVPERTAATLMANAERLSELRQVTHILHERIERMTEPVIHPGASPCGYTRATARTRHVPPSAFRIRRSSGKA
jgi:hypothetical protein